MIFPFLMLTLDGKETVHGHCLILLTIEGDKTRLLREVVVVILYLCVRGDGLWILILLLFLVIGGIESG